MKLDLVQLKVFDTLMREHSLTRCADLLDMSQPTVSRVLARLRDHFEDPLFVRAGHSMRPTARALALADTVSAVLDGVAQLGGPPARFDPATDERCFRLYMVDGGIVHALPRLLHALPSAAPRVTLRSVHTHPRELEQLLEAGRIDLAIGSFPLLLTNIHQRPLWTDDYATVMRPGHACAQGLERADFLSQRHVLVVLGDTDHEYAAAARILEAALAPRTVLCQVPSFTAAAHLVLHTDALATMPRRLALSLAHDLGLHVADTPLALPTLRLGLYWHEQGHRDPAGRWFRNWARGVLADPGGDAGRD